MLETVQALEVIDANRVDLGCRNMSGGQVPFPVSLSRQRRPSASWPSVTFIYLTNADEEARRVRIARGFNAKLPKLMAWKRKHGARTVLVFENNDIQLTDHIVVAEALLKIVATSPNRPDEVYLVSSCEEPWQVIAM